MIVNNQKSREFDYRGRPFRVLVPLKQLENTIDHSIFQHALSFTPFVMDNKEFHHTFIENDPEDLFIRYPPNNPLNMDFEGQELYIRKKLPLQRILSQPPRFLDVLLERSVIVPYYAVGEPRYQQDHALGKEVGVLWHYVIYPEHLTRVLLGDGDHLLSLKVVPLAIEYGGKRVLRYKLPLTMIKRHYPIFYQELRDFFYLNDTQRELLFSKVFPIIYRPLRNEEVLKRLLNTLRFVLLMPYVPFRIRLASSLTEM